MIAWRNIMNSYDHLEMGNNCGHDKSEKSTQPSYSKQANVTFIPFSFKLSCVSENGRKWTVANEKGLSMLNLRDIITQGFKHLTTTLSKKMPTRRF